jgi:O-antigen/teichoic acid export membrane protein
MTKYCFLFLAKACSFFGLFIFAKFLDINEVGQISTYQVMQFFLIPILSLQIPAAIFRFYGEHDFNDEIDLAFKYANVFLLCSFLLVLVFSMSVNIYVGVLASAFCYIVFYINLEYLRRSSGDNTYFFLLFLQVLLFLVFSLIFIFALEQKGLKSLLLSECISIYVIWLLFSVNKKIAIPNKFFNKMLRYSLPLIPASMCWWLLSAGIIYMVSILYGDKATAQFNLSYKIPSFVIVLSSLISAVWQSEFLVRYNEKTLDSIFIKSRCNLFVMISIVLCLVFFAFSNLIIYFFYSEYFMGFTISALISIMTVLYAVNAFIGMQYIISCNTKRDFTILSIGSVVTMLFGYLFGFFFDIQGLLIGYIIGLGFILFVRVGDFLKWQKSFS